MLKKNRLLATVLSFALLANTLAGAFTSLAESDASAVAGVSKTSSGIDNSSLLPSVNAPVTPVAVDGSSTAWTPDWVSDLMIVELNVATASTNGKFSGMETALAHLAETGVNGVWLTPINQVSASGATGYRNYGPSTVNTYLTGTADYESGWAVVKDFVDLAHSYNIRVFFDLVTWGTDVHADLVTDHPEYYVSTSTVNSSGGYSFNWNNQDLYQYMLTSSVAMITKTGADGFRADVGTRYAGAGFFADIRKTLMTEHSTYIAMFSESPTDRGGVFDFDEHTATSYANSDYRLLTENNIVDVITQGNYIDSAGNKYYSSLISCHDAYDYAYEVAGNSVALGYASILSPMIPMWYLGEEWKNVSTNEYTVTNGVKSGAQLYRTSIDWNSVDENKEYLETIKKYIQIRRTHSDIFSDFPADNRNTSICKVTTSGGAGLYQAYARYNANEAILVVPNNSNAAVSFTVTLPFTEMGYAAGTYEIRDLMNDCVVGYTSDTSFLSTVAADSVGVYSVKKAVTINKVKLGTASSANDILCSDAAHVSGNLLVFNIVFNASNKVIPTTSDVVNYYQKHMTVDAATSAVGGTTVGLDLCSKILINGKTIAECIRADSRGQYSAIHAQLLYLSAMGGDTLRICIPEDNGYGVSKTANCTIELLEDISFNGYAVQPAKFVYYAAKSTRTDVFATGGGYNYTNGKTNAGTVYSTPTEFSDIAYEDGVITLTANRYLENASNDLAAAAAKISINGSAISASVLSVCANKMKIAYANGGNDFKLYITNGATLNGYELNTTRYQYAAETESFSVPTKTATVMKNNVPDSGLAYINLQFRDGSEDFGMTMQASGSVYVAQYITCELSPVWNETALKINEYIKFNGETVGEINGRYKATSFNYLAAAFSTKFDNYSGLGFRLDYKNNSGIATVGNYFTAEILDGLMIDGFKITPVTAMSNKSNSATSSFLGALGVAASDNAFWGNTFNLSGGAVVVCDSTGTALNQNNTVGKGESLYFKVTPNAGNQLKFGTLTYTYWYKGTKVVADIKDAVTNETGTYYVLPCPGVCGTVNATFSAVDDSALNAAVLGVHDKTTGAAGIRFITRVYTDNLDLANQTVTINGNTFAITDFGTLVGFAWDEDLTYGNAKAIKAENSVYQTGGSFVDLKAEILNIPEELLEAEFAARGYLVYNNGEEDVVLYTGVYTAGAVTSGLKVNPNGNSPVTAAVVTDGEDFYEFADANDDDSVDIRDLVCMKKYLSLTGEAVEQAADINSDGSIDSLDLVALRKYLLGTELTVNWTNTIR